MKHLASLLLLMPFCASATAQSALHERDQRTERSALRASPMRISFNSQPSPARGGGCLFSEDFETGAIPADWDIGAPVEQYSDDATNPVPQGTFVDAWAVGTSADANNGGFVDIPDVPTGNQFAYANDDGDPCNCAMENIGLVTPNYDLTGLAGIGLRARVWHDGQYANSTGTVEARVNGGAWNTIYTLAEDDGWQDVAVVLTDYQGQSNVQFRFQWDDGGGWGTAIAVDDVCITQLPGNDLALTGSWIAPDPDNYEDALVRNIEYRNLPLVETIPLGVSAPVINNGSATQTGVTLSVTIEHDGSNYGPFTSSSTTLDPGQRDTLVVNTGWTPTSTGEVEVTYTLYSADPTDAYPDDNSNIQLFNVTGAATSEGANAMGCDDGSLDVFYYLSINTDSANYDALATRFQVEGTGNMAYGVGIAFSDQGTTETLFNVYLLDDNGEVTNVLDNILEAGDVNAGGGSYFKTVLFDDPVELDPGVDYEVWVENINEERIAIGASGVVTPGGLLGHEIDDTQNTIYIGFGNPALMIRLYLSEAVGVEEEQAAVVARNIRPNPATTTATMPFTLRSATAMRYALHDVNGRLVAMQDIGMRPAGANEVSIDLSTIPAGAYDLSLQGDGINTHSKLVVVH